MCDYYIIFKELREFAVIIINIKINLIRWSRILIFLERGERNC